MVAIKTFFSFFALSLFVFTHAHAEKDLNSVMNGTYAYNETWFCSFPDFPGPPPIILNVSGIISFDGNGNAQDRGSFGIIAPPNPMNPMNITINTHRGLWEYQVFDNPEECTSEGEAPDEDVICDFKYLGTRILSDLDNDPDEDEEVQTGQVLYGKIGKRGNGFTGNGNTTDVILIERHDGAMEFIDGNPSGICDKAGTLVKISDFPQDLVDEDDFLAESQVSGFPAENQVGGFPAENQVGGFPAQ